MSKKFQSIKTGVIGAGSMGQNHVRVYSEISDLIGISDPDEELGKKIADKYGIMWFSDHRSLLEHVDAVSVAVPTSLHKAISKDVIVNEKHLLVEKPLSDSTKNASEILDLAKKFEVILSVGHVERYNPTITSVQDFLKSSDFGQILTITARRFSNYPYRIRDVGVLFDLTIHDVDLLNSFIRKRPISVFAAGGNHINEQFEDYVNLIINYEA